MAKNFLDHALSLLGLKPPNSADYYDPSVYRAEASKSEAPSKPTKVAQYQQKKNVDSDKPKKLSGVAKYLAEKQAPAQDKIDIETEEASVAKLSGVAKYLAAKQQEEQLALENMTGVEKYLYSLKTGHKITHTVNTPITQKAAPKKLSRVDMYLAKKQGVELDPAVVSNAQKKPEEVPEVTSEIKTKKVVLTQAKEDPAPQIIEAASKEIIDLSKGATQCQASTVKRTQCSRTTSLETIEQSINQKQYRFAVCSQHDKNSFIPFAQILQEKSL